MAGLVDGTTGLADTLAWLLDGDPSICWQVLRDLTGAPSEKVEAERALIATSGWGRRLLQLQGPDGLNLARTIREPETCITSRLVLLASSLGFRDEWVDTTVEWLLGQQLHDGGWNCESIRNGSRYGSFHTSISVLDALLAYERTGGAVAVAASRSSPVAAGYCTDRIRAATGFGSNRRDPVDGRHSERFGSWIGGETVRRGQLINAHDSERLVPRAAPHAGHGGAASYTWAGSGSREKRMQ